MIEATASRDAVLSELLADAGLPGAVDVRPIVGRGFGGGVHAVTLAGGRRAVLRVFSRRVAPEWPRAAFFESHAVPAPRLLATTAAGSLHEFVEGTLLGDLIEAGDDSPAVWRSVGQGFR